jgi:hypothetical protein
MRCHSPTYQAFDVSFHLALEPTTQTGAAETIQPAHTSHRSNRMADCSGSRPR